MVFSIQIWNSRRSIPMRKRRRSRSIKMRKMRSRSIPMRKRRSSRSIKMRKMRSRSITMRMRRGRNKTPETCSKFLKIKCKS